MRLVSEDRGAAETVFKGDARPSLAEVSPIRYFLSDRGAYVSAARTADREAVDPIVDDTAVRVVDEQRRSPCRPCRCFALIMGVFAAWLGDRRRNGGRW